MSNTLPLLMVMPVKSVLLIISSLVMVHVKNIRHCIGVPPVMAFNVLAVIAIITI